MWSAAKLTWDCTVIDKSRDISATGITELVRRRFHGNESNSEPTEPDDTDEDSHVSSDAQAGNLIRAFFRSKGERKEYARNLGFLFLDGSAAHLWNRTVVREGESARRLWMGRFPVRRLYGCRAGTDDDDQSAWPSTLLAKTTNAYAARNR